jgi:serine/threonine-protein kinase
MTAALEMLLERIRAATANEYEIDRQIGAGGMATVFLARDIALDRPVAIKVMRPELIDVERVQDRFVIEARTAAKLGHPGIVTVYSIKQGAGLLYIVMRYVEGRTVEEILRERFILDPATVVAIIARVADALHFAHGKGIVHRDVKPSNIIIDMAGQPVVTDFGIARVSTAPGITMAGSMLGTPTYMSPEQCRGMPVTPASDQYSLGVMTYQMLTGRTPFTGEFFELIEAHKNQAPPSLGDLASGLDPMLEQTVMRMLAKDPADRWGSLAEVAQHLVMANASPREIEQMQATLSFLRTGLPPEILTPPPVVPVAEPTPPAARVPTPAPTPVAGLAPADVVVSDPTPTDARVPEAPIGVPPAGETGRGSGRALIAVAALLALLLVTFTVVWNKRNASVDTVVVPADTVRPRDTAATQPPAQQPAQTTTSPDSAATTSPTPKRDSVVPTGQTPPRRSTTTTTPPVKGRTAPSAAECARLLERVSLGEKLSAAEQTALRACRR